MLQSQTKPLRQVCRAEGGKGFGTAKAPKPNPKKKGKALVVDNKEAVRKAVKLAGDSKNNPIDPKEAAQGKIDYAKVKSWGSEKQRDAGNLQLESFIPGELRNAENLAFYNRLTLKIIQDTENGVIDDILYSRLPVPLKRDVPQGDSWTYTKPRYIQYLTDLHAVHHALEIQVADLLVKLSERNEESAALDCFSQARGLERSAQIAVDLENLGHSKESHPGPSLHVQAYTKYLNDLGDSNAAQDSKKASLRLIAHIYASHLHQFTYGSKLGASIAEKLNLFRLNAVHLFRSYPQNEKFPDKNPFKAFTANVNACGQLLSEEQKAEIEGELALATAHCMQLVEALAETD